MPYWKEVLDKRHPDREQINLAIRYKQECCVTRAIESAVGLPQRARTAKVEYLLRQIDSLFNDFFATSVPPNLFEENNLIKYLYVLRAGDTPLALALQKRNISSDVLPMEAIKEFVDFGDK
jgi:hypothetical protein